MNKYNARSVEIDGHRFASVAEGRRYAVLAAHERAGKIAGLELQPRFDCVVAGVKVCSYIGDFRYHRDGAVVVEDVKGLRTALDRLKRKLAEPAKFGGSLGVAAGSTNSGVIGPRAFYAPTPVRLTANGSAFTGGAVRVAVHYLMLRGSVG